MAVMAPRSSYQLRQVLQHLIQPLLGGWRPQQCQGRTLQRSTDYLICKDNHRQRHCSKMMQNVANLYTELTQNCHNLSECTWTSQGIQSWMCSDGFTALVAACLLFFELSVWFNLIRGNCKGFPIHDSACDGPTLPQYSNTCFVYQCTTRSSGCWAEAPFAANKWPTKCWGQSSASSTLSIHW